jgi:hypothetical protein
MVHVGSPSSDPDVDVCYNTFKVMPRVQVHLSSVLLGYGSKYLNIIGIWVLVPFSHVDRFPYYGL